MRAVHGSAVWEKSSDGPRRGRGGKGWEVQSQARGSAPGAAAKYPELGVISWLVHGDAPTEGFAFPPLPPCGSFRPFPEVFTDTSGCESQGRSHLHLLPVASLGSAA